MFKKPLPIPKPKLFPSQSKGQRSLDNFTDENYLYKFPRLNDIDTLINEFFATRVAAKIVSLAQFDLVIPEAHVKLEKEKPCLQISLIPDYKKLKRLGNNFSKSTYNQPLLQALLIDLLVGNIDGHMKNLGLDVGNRLAHIDFDRSFEMKLGTIEQNIEEIASATREGFAQQDLIQGNNIQLLKQLVSKVRSIAGIEKTMRDCLNQAAAELRKVPEISEVDIDLALATAQTYIQNQLEKLWKFEHSTAKAPKIVPPTPCKQPQKRTVHGGLSKAGNLFGEDRGGNDWSIHRAPLSMLFREELETSHAKRQRTDLNLKDDTNLPLINSFRISQ